MRGRRENPKNQNRWILGPLVAKKIWLLSVSDVDRTVSGCCCSSRTDRLARYKLNLGLSMDNDQVDPMVIQILRKRIRLFCCWLFYSNSCSLVQIVASMELINELFACMGLFRERGLECANRDCVREFVPKILELGPAMVPIVMTQR